MLTDLKSNWYVGSLLKATRLVTLYFKGIRFLSVICRFAVQLNIQLHLPIVFKLSREWGFRGEDSLSPLG